MKYVPFNAVRIGDQFGMFNRWIKTGVRTAETEGREYTFRPDDTVQQDEQPIRTHHYYCSDCDLDWAKSDYDEPEFGAWSIQSTCVTCEAEHDPIFTDEGKHNA